jgi:hypothetical protein
MIRLTLTDEQAQLIAGASQPIDVVDSQGRALGKIAPTPQNQSDPGAISDADLAEIKRRMAADDGTRFTMPEMLEHLRTLASE